MQGVAANWYHKLEFSIAKVTLLMSDITVEDKGHSKLYSNFASSSTCEKAFPDMW